MSVYGAHRQSEVGKWEGGMESLPPFSWALTFWRQSPFLTVVPLTKELVPFGIYWLRQFTLKLVFFVTSRISSEMNLKILLSNRCIITFWNDTNIAHFSYVLRDDHINLVSRRCAALTFPGTTVCGTKHSFIYTQDPRNTQSRCLYPGILLNVGDEKFFQHESAELRGPIENSLAYLGF